MIKFIKEIFSAENLKRAIIYGSLANPSINSEEILHLSNVIKNMNAENIDNKKVEIKKVA